MSFLNTKSKGSVRNVVFQEGNEWFAVALEFNIVEQGDSPLEAMLLLNEAMIGYVESANKSKMSMSVLNQEVDPEYELLWSSKPDMPELEGKKVYSQSFQNIEALVA